MNFAELMEMHGALQTSIDTFPSVPGTLDRFDHAERIESLRLETSLISNLAKEPDRQRIAELLTQIRIKNGGHTKLASEKRGHH